MPANTTAKAVALPGDRHPKVLMVNTFDLDDSVFEALRAGPSGFLFKDARSADVVSPGRVVAAGDGLLAPSVTRRLIEEFARRPGQAAVLAYESGLVRPSGG